MIPRLLLILGLFGWLPALAQTTYPVQVNAHLLPPYSLYLSDYYGGTREKLTLTLLNRDLMQPSLNVQLRLSINAPGGLRIQTRPEAYLPSITLESGQPLRLSLEELAPYFQPQNFFEQGAFRDGKLPEGMVEFCFQAFEAYTNQPLSAPGCTRAFITSQKPSLLSLPQNNESIAFREPLNLLFQWTPRHQGLTYVEYEFILKELIDNGMPPQAAFPYAPEIYRETVRSTSLFYGAMQAPLLPGKRYAWIVRAQAREGIEEVNLFQNNGYSEVCSFTLQDNCTPPLLVKATAERKRINLSWQPLTESVGYTVSYRLQDPTQANEWKEISTLEPQATLSGLQKGGTYQYRVGSACLAGQPVYGAVLSLTLPPDDSARLAQCGVMPALHLSNQTPIASLKTSEVITAGDFPVTLTKVSGSNGIFTGEGWTVIPWLNDAKIAVTFASITVNTDKQMIGGYIDARYDANQGQIANLDDIFEGGFDVGKVKTGLSLPDYTFDFSIPGVEAFRLSEEGELIITDSNGESHTVIAPQDKEGTGNEGNQVVVFPMTVQDKDGKIYRVEKVADPAHPGKEMAKATYVGKATTPLAAGSFDPSQLNGDKALVTFEKGAGVYGFDTWQPHYEKIALIRDKYQQLFRDYYAPWKLLPVGKTDVVRATIAITDPAIDPSQVIFTTPQGTTFQADYDPATKTYQLQVMAGPAGDAQEVYALHPKGQGKYYNLGKLSIASYTPQSHKVVLVSVEGAPVEEGDIREALAQVYGPAAISWQVEKAPGFAYTGNQRLMEQSTGLSTYNAEMRALNEAYRQAIGAQYDPRANYLFFLKATGAAAINERDLTGFMPRGGQFGYLFTSEIERAKQAMTAAHELGHGRWKLYHPFDKHYGGFAQGQTDNVMDYANGSHLAKWQWDLIHDPAMLVSVFEGDEKSEMSAQIECNPLLVPHVLQNIAARAKQCDNDVDDDIEKIADADLAKLCIDQRIDLIKCIDDFPAQGGDDEALIRLLKSTPNNHKTNLMSRLQDEKIYQNRLIEAVDGEEFLELVNTISQWMGTPTQADWEEAVVSNRFLFFDGEDAFLAGFNGSSIVLKTRRNFSIGWYQEVMVKPHEYVAVIFTNDFIIAGKEFKAGNQVTMSGIAVWSLFNETFNKRMRVASAILLDIPLLYVGVGEVRLIKNLAGVSKAIRILRYAKATTDIIVATGGLVMAFGMEDELGLTEEGREVLRYWTWFNLIYAGGTLTPHAINSAKGLYSSIKNLLSRPNISANLRVSLEKWMETLRNVFKKNGKNIDDVNDLNLIYSRLGELKPPARALLENENVLIDASKGLQSSKVDKFKSIITGEHGDLNTKYLWTIDERGINTALEKTPFPTPRGNIVHTNLSSKAYIGGEMWFSSSNKVIINAGSGRFGDGAGATLTQWEAAIDFWKKLGYEVEAIPLGAR
jgi:hypothetical protein